MSIEIAECNFDIDEIIQTSGLTQDTKDNLSKSTLILLPASFPSSTQRGNFASETPNLLKYIRIKHPEIQVALFENSGEERIQVLQAADIILPIILIYETAKSASFQILLNMLSSYLYDKLRGDPNYDGARVKTEIIFKKSRKGKSIRIKYEGPVSGLKEIEVDTILKTHQKAKCL
jgi:hypothetical protein